MKKVFIDTDIILDLFAKREPFYQYAAELFTLIDDGIIEGYVSSLIFSNLYYILGREKSKEQAKRVLLKLKVLTNILPVDEKIIDLALSSNLKDFEDSIQYHVAQRYKIGILITRNVKDFKNANIEAMTAEEFIKLLNLK